jgi:hypothetical protein
MDTSDLKYMDSTFTNEDFDKSTARALITKDDNDLTAGKNKKSQNTLYIRNDETNINTPDTKVQK